MKLIIHPNYISRKQEIAEMIENFDSSGTLFGDGKRNVIRVFSNSVNIKSFKVPSLVNKVVYRFFRKSKAQRSFEYAVKLQENNIGTPDPIAYSEYPSFFGLGKSFYVSAHLHPDLTFRELVTNPDYPDHENILRQFTQFSFNLHQKGIEFLDHSPGNTLILKVSESKYEFFLVDLNRMNFHVSMTFEQRMNNMRRLTYKPEMIAVMSDEYAKLSGMDYRIVYETMLGFKNDFHKKLQRKRKLKKVFKFWKK